ncbi:acetyl/propionyl/methylcrotonyl-CoA carboxylase subunit alpha [Burkholderia sp. S171]|uniref:acetyl-CoA carboxylase biotin carboxylase subunit n=1 Tax=Burkholderia sp. S171 TaxID=1641860 RepID=UPI00131B5D0B|nr:biotin carboxylase N-terminal domain-containing protein [Burkholderia sp. S171]
MFNKVLIANRGAIAARVVRALRQMKIASVVVYSEADRDLPYVVQADEAICIGEAAPAASYLNVDALSAAIRQSGADAVHPGYGFLSENPDFATAVSALGVTFIGPDARWLRAMGRKTEARALMASLGMPLNPSSGVLAGTPDQQLAAVRNVGFPVLVKPVAGGGGIGMLPARDEAQVIDALERARSMSQRSFGNADVYVERLIERPRHIEFQLLADKYGQVRHLFERDCSIQRRHQKVIEESPAPHLPRALIEETGTRIARILSELGYDVIGTAEMLYGQDGSLSFLEMNTRLQVEHAVTEAITGIDLVQAQIRLAAGMRLDAVLPASIEASGHAIEVRVYAEDPRRFFPSPGPLNVFRPPTARGVRVETGYAEGNRVTPFYDPMLAKVIVHEATREQAIARMLDALADFEVVGVKTNIPFSVDVLRSDAFQAGDVHTQLGAALTRA